MDIIENFKKRFTLLHLMVYDLKFTTPCWPATSCLLHLPNFREGGQGPLAPPRPQYANARHPCEYKIHLRFHFVWGGGSTVTPASSSATHRRY